MRVLITGGFGSVGQSTINELIKKGHAVRVFERETKATKKIAHKFKNKVEVVFGDILNVADVLEAVRGTEVVIHLAAIIPPLADRNPHLAEHVNVDGTHNIIYAMERQTPPPRLVFTSSISVFGDRAAAPYISRTDLPNPNHDDNYAHHKLACEKMIRQSSLIWSIFRLTYIVDAERLHLDPIMFNVPLNTSIEICDTKDVGHALAEAITCTTVWGETLPIAGGVDCRTTYREYLESMLGIFGLGRFKLPEIAFTKNHFHCGYLDTEESQQKLHYQGRRLDDFYKEVKSKYAARRRFYRLFRTLGKKILFLKSPYYVDYLKGVLGNQLTKGALYLKFLFSPKWNIN